MDSVQHVPDAIQHQGTMVKTPQLKVRPLPAYGELHTSYCFYGNLTVLVQKRDSEYFSTVIPQHINIKLVCVWIVL